MYILGIVKNKESQIINGSASPLDKFSDSLFYLDRQLGALISLICDYDRKLIDEIAYRNRHKLTEIPKYQIIRESLLRVKSGNDLVYCV